MFNKLMTIVGFCLGLFVLICIVPVLLQIILAIFCTPIWVFILVIGLVFIGFILN